MLVANMAPNPFVSVSFAPVLEAPRRTMIEIIRDEQWVPVYRRVNKVPEQVRDKCLVNLDGQSTEAYPLHYLCKNKDVPLAIVDAFLGTCPEAARTPDAVLGWLPIHIACKHDASVAVLDMLVQAYPEGLSTADKDGNLPLHYACALESPECARYLLQACSETVSLKNNKGQTPLHLACSRYDVSTELVQELIQLDKDACRVHDWQKRLPLHSACMWKASTQVIEMLLRCYPQSLRETDSHNMNPYDICRKVVHLDHHDSTVKLLRSYQKKNGDLLIRVRDSLRYKTESLSDSLGIHAHKPLHHANAG